MLSTVSWLVFVGSEFQAQGPNQGQHKSKTAKTTVLPDILRKKNAIVAVVAHQ